MVYKFFRAQKGMTTCCMEEVALLGVLEYLLTPACPHLSQVLNLMDSSGVIIIVTLGSASF